MHEQLTAYRELRQNRQIPYQLFEELVYLFPTVLVHESNGRFDAFEKGNIRYITENTAREHGLNEDLLKAEIDYIKNHISEVKPLLLTALKHFNQEHDIANDVLDQMLSSARVSSESQRNNLIFSNYHNFFDIFRSFISYFLEPDPEKPFIREDEKTAMLEVLEAIDGVSERNYQILQSLAKD